MGIRPFFIEKGLKGMETTVEGKSAWKRRPLSGKIPGVDQDAAPSRRQQSGNAVNDPLNHKETLCICMLDGRYGLSNNAAGRRVKSYAIGRKNSLFHTSVAEAEASALVYIMIEAAKANNLKPYDYFEYLLTGIPKHLDVPGRSFLDDLLPWSPSLPENCRKPGKNEVK